MNSSIKQVNCVGAGAPWASSTEVSVGVLGNSGGGYRMAAHPHPGIASELGPLVQWDCLRSPGYPGESTASLPQSAVSLPSQSLLEAAAPPRSPQRSSGRRRHRGLPGYHPWRLNCDQTPYTVPQRGHRWWPLQRVQPPINSDISGYS